MRVGAVGVERQRLLRRQRMLAAHRADTVAVVERIEHHLDVAQSGRDHARHVGEEADGRIETLRIQQLAQAGQGLAHRRPERDRLRRWRDPVEPGTNSSSPIASRRRRKALLTAGCVIARRSAARVTLRSTMTTSKTRSRFRSRVRKFIGPCWAAVPAAAPLASPCKRQTPTLWQAIGRSPARGARVAAPGAALGVDRPCARAAVS